MAAGPRGDGAASSAWRANSAGTWAFVERFFDALVATGVEAVCVSPGSRSTPLAMVALGTRGLTTSVHLDERSAGFFALGRARVSRRPVALVCTSGTAAANYLPAVIEAHYSGVPLIVLTADRPPELREWGAGQTIDQRELYGRHALAYFEVPVPEAGDDALRFAERLAARAIAKATSSPFGPVHLNFPFREPLEPPGDHIRSSAVETAPVWFDPASRAPTHEEIARLTAQVQAHERGLVCVGTLDQTEADTAAIARFAARAGWPVLADPLSQMRCGPHVVDSPIVTTAECLLRSQAFAAAMRADVVLRLGGAPVSKSQRLWLAEHPPARLWLVDEQARWEEPGHHVTEHVDVSPAALLAAADAELESIGFQRGERVPSAWRTGWMDAEAVAMCAIEQARRESSGGLLEADVVEVLAEVLPEGAVVMLSNSMPIRDVDVFWRARDAGVRFIGNRGANGIDGINSTALGAAAAAGAAPVVSLVGDLALLHDVGGLLAAGEIAGSLTHVVLDNDGGGIFDFLPIADRAPKADFERLFTTPHGRELRALGDLFDLRFEDASDAARLRKLLEQAIGAPGMTLVRVRTQRDANLEAFRAVMSAVTSAADRIAAGLES